MKSLTGAITYTSTCDYKSATHDFITVGGGLQHISCYSS